MKRFLLFSHPNYYAWGGWDDFIADFDTLAEAQARADEMADPTADRDMRNRADNQHVVDQETGTIVVAREVDSHFVDGHVEVGEWRTPSA